MSPAQQLHRTAMSIASEAQAAYLAGNLDVYERLTKEAFAKEKEAALQLQHKLEFEPTRSILLKGAAQLAYNCGEYQEAEQLIAKALLGNPPDTLRQELRRLNRQVMDAVEWLSLGQNAHVPDYLQQLRAQALHIWVQPKRLTHLTAVYLDNVIDVLKKVRDSFISYVEIDFWKNFQPADFKDPDKLLASLREEANPLLVNQEFKSFAASISSDLVVMTKQYSPEINQWKRTVFARYKTDVFEGANYESEKAAEQLATPYSRQERRRIFQPVLDLFKESNNYTLSLTDSQFREKSKVYKPATKQVRNILVPVLSDEDAQRQKSLYQIWGLGDADSGKGKMDVISKQEMDSASFTHTLSHIKFEREEVYLSEPIELSIRYEKPVFYLSFAPLGLELSAGDYNELLKVFQQHFVETYSRLQHQPNASFSVDEAIVWEYLSQVVFTKGKS